MHQSDPEWAPFFMNYKFLKKKIKEIKVGRRSRQPAAMRAGTPPRSSALVSSGALVPRSMLLAVPPFLHPPPHATPPLTQPAPPPTPPMEQVLRGESVDAEPAAIQRPQGQKSANDIAAGAGEKMFFRALHAELRKTTVGGISHSLWPAAAARACARLRRCGADESRSSSIPLRSTHRARPPAPALSEP